MPVYEYQALQPPSSCRSGTLSADSPRTARAALRARGLQIREIREATAARNVWRPKRHRGRLPSFLRELSTLLSVGVPLDDALDQMTRQHRGSFRLLLLDLRERIASGQNLSEAFSAHEGTFDELCVAIAQAGEDAGALDKAMARLADFKERSHELAGKVTTTLLYPMIVLTLAVGIAIFLMTFVVPSILEPLIEMGRPLPMPTRIVQAISQFLVSWGWVAGIGMFALVLSCGWAAKRAVIRRRLDAAVLRIPILGDLVRKTLILRIAVVISALLSTGVVFLQALKIAAATTRNTVIRDALQRCEQAVSAGSDIAAALDATSAFPPVVIQVFAIGEQSGQLGELLERLAVSYDRDVAIATQRLTSLLEPALILSLAGVVLLIAMATMLPIMEVSDALQ